MMTRKLIGLAGTVAICVGTTGLVRAAGDSAARQIQVTQPVASAQPILQAGGVVPNAAVPLAASAISQVPGIPGAPPAPGVPGIPGAAGAAGAAGAPAAAAPMTLWSFLGVPNCEQIKKCCTELMQLLGLPPKVPPLGGPEALKSSNPAMKAAAAAKAEKDAKGAKIKAIRYLAKLENACCYPGVMDALLAALDDCDWEVRREAALAFGKACCCDPKVVARLKKIVNDVDQHGNYREPVDEVRCAADKSLQICMCRCAPQGPPPPPEVPKQGPEAPKETPAAAKGTPRVKELNRTTGLLVYSSGTEILDMDDSAKDEVELVGGSEDTLVFTDATAQQTSNTAVKMVMPFNADRLPIQILPFKGSVSVVDKKTGVASVTLKDGVEPMPGSKAQLYHKYPLRMVHVGEVEVVAIAEDKVLIRPSGAMPPLQIKKGDTVVVEPSSAN